MKIKAITTTGIPPIKHFSIDNCSDVLVLAGPNGVGKTRLMNHIIRHFETAQPSSTTQVVIEATNEEEAQAWGRSTLETKSSEDMRLLRRTLHVNRRRHNWQSSVLRFESDRSISKISPFPFSWDDADPYDEQINWNITFSPMRARFQDTLHSMFRLIEHQKRSIANRAIQLRESGETVMQLGFEDPMAPFKEVFARLLSPKEMCSPSAKKQVLEYTIEGERFDFDKLSSGEREVVNLAFDFLLRRPQDCIIFFDEPELHLHPELSFRLIRTLQDAGVRNQFFFCTHSPDIITASLNQTVVFVAPPDNSDDSAEPRNQAVIVREDDETHQALRLLGHSIGIIALGKKIVLIEGEQASLDKQVYGTIVQDSFPSLVLVPAGGKRTLTSFAKIYERVLEKTLWGVEFFVLCDRDSAPNQNVLDTPRLKVLSKYHLENYFLDEDVWAQVFSEMEPEGSWMRSSAQINEKLREIAKQYVSYAVALCLSARLRFTVGSVNVMPSDCHGKTVEELEQLILNRVTDESRRISDALDSDSIRAQLAEHSKNLEASLQLGNDSWKKMMPGRPILQSFVAATRLSIERAKSLYIERARMLEAGPFEEIKRVFTDFSNT